jgi:hypothetical protein
VAEVDVSPDYVDATAQDVEPKRTQAQNAAELGFEAEQFDADFPPVEKTAEVPAVQMYKYNSQEIMLTVAKILNYDNKTTMQALYEARKANKIAQAMTIEEAQAWANALIAPK